MNSVQFDEGDYGVENQSTSPAMLRWVLSSGLAKTEQQAVRILVAIAVIALLVAGTLVFSAQRGGAPSEPIPYSHSNPDLDV